MTLRSKRRLLLLTNVALVAAAAALAAGAAWLPLAHPKLAGTGPADSGSDLARPAGAGRPTGYSVIYETDLRRPLFDPAPTVVTPPAPPPKPKLEAVLTGTAVDPGSTFGIFKTKGGEVRLVSVGETVDGAEVLSIEEGKATVRFHGDILTLTVHKE